MQQLALRCGDRLREQTSRNVQAGLRRNLGIQNSNETALHMFSGTIVAKLAKLHVRPNRKMAVYKIIRNTYFAVCTQASSKIRTAILFSKPGRLSKGTYNMAMMPINYGNSTVLPNIRFRVLLTRRHHNATVLI